MINNLQSGKTVAPNDCRAQMYILSSHDIKTWCIVAARRNATEAEAARIALKAQAEAARIAAEDKAEAEDEAARIALVTEAEPARRFAARCGAGVATRIAAEAVAEADAVMRLAAEAKADPSPSTEHLPTYRSLTTVISSSTGICRLPAGIIE
jgi:hypothetical protein